MPKELVLKPVDFYDSYRKERPKHLRVSKAQYTRIITMFFYLLALEIIRERYIWKMPFNMGKIMITKRRFTGKHKPIDWAETNKRGKIIRHTNLHTNGFTFRWFWAKPLRRLFRNGEFYEFKPVLDAHKREIGSRGLAQHIKDCAYDPYKKPYDAPMLAPPK